MPPEGPSDDNSAAEGPTFSLPVKVLATLLVALVAIYAFRIAEHLHSATWSASAAFLMLGAVAITVVCYYRMLRSRTAIDAQCIRQDFLWPKRVALADITQAKF